MNEPELKRGFVVPGGMAGAVTCGLFPGALLILAMIESDHESILGINALVFGAAIIALGFLAYFATSRLRSKYAAIPSETTELA